MMYGISRSKRFVENFALFSIVSSEMRNVVHIETKTHIQVSS